MKMLQTIRSSSLDRHSHSAAYAAIVLSGGYEEAGDQGRFRAEPGDVLLHERFETHINRLPISGAVVLNLMLPANVGFSAGLVRFSDPDSIIRLAERDESEAAYVLLSASPAVESRPADWPDELARSMIRNPSLGLAGWCRKNGLASWTVSRGFSQVFGVSPSAFRARVRARQAWQAICQGDDSMASIAIQLGFADQSHMTRSVKQLTGMSPRCWTGSANGFKTPGYVRV
jgi:AraC-like DNA-binding protein